MLQRFKLTIILLFLILNLTAKSNNTYLIYDLTGRLISTKISELPVGVYLLKSTDNDITVTELLIITHPKA